MSEQHSSHCPIAVNLAQAVAPLSPRQSHDKVELTVEAPQRCYQVQTTVQRALGSLFGLISALSDCPYTRPLRPMGYFHLPVASERETLLRTVSFFVLKRFLDQRDTDCKHIDLKELEAIYRNLNTLNRCFVGRLRGALRTDATVNALIHLDLLVRDVSFELSEQLEVLGPLFGSQTSSHPAAV